MDSNGIKTAEQSFGGNGFQQSASLFAATADGGFLLAGVSDAGPSGNKTSPHFGERDFWLVRVDANGNKLWDKSFGGTGTDFPIMVREKNGGFLVEGWSNSNASGNKTNAAVGFWLLGLDVNGNKLWEQVLAAADIPYSPFLITPTPDGGYVFGGSDYRLYYPDPEEPSYSKKTEFSSGSRRCKRSARMAGVAGRDG